MSSLIPISMQIDGIDEALQKLSELDNRAFQRGLRPAVQAVANVSLKEMKRIAPKTTGAFRRSLVVKSRRVKPGARSVTALVGQKKVRKTAVKVSAKGLARGSQITRGGNAAPIHFLDRSTKQHQIKAKKGKALRFLGTRVSKAGSVTVTRRGTVKATKAKYETATVLASRVKHPGTSPQYLIANTARNSRSAATTAFHSAIAKVLTK